MATLYRKLSWNQTEMINWLASKVELIQRQKVAFTVIKLYYTIFALTPMPMVRPPQKKY